MTYCFQHGHCLLSEHASQQHRPKDLPGSCPYRPSCPASALVAVPSVVPSSTWTRASNAACPPLPHLNLSSQLPNLPAQTVQLKVQVKDQLDELSLPSQMASLSLADNAIWKHFPVQMNCSYYCILLQLQKNTPLSTSGHLFVRLLKTKPVWKVPLPSCAELLNQQYWRSIGVLMQYKNSSRRFYSALFQ